ncbi:MAG: peptidase M50, partial [Magnetococcales bacterium]|nr:peptidase M50 [Magnetococcales bacterium]
MIRPDLELYPGPPGDDGSPSWTLFDPLRHRFFRLGWVEHAIFSHWGRGEKSAILTSAQTVVGSHATGERVEAMARFLVVQ